MSNQGQSGYPPDKRFDFPFPGNAEGFQNPANGGTDRLPKRDAVLPVPPPRTNGGADGMGAAPRRDKRRSRSQGQNVCAVINQDFAEARPTVSAQLASFDTGPDEGGEESSTLMLSFKTYDFAENAVTGLGMNVPDPFAGVSSSLLPDTVLQSLEVVCNLQWGHDGVNEKVVVNMPAGQIVRGGLSGTYCRANAKIIPRYFQRFLGADTGDTTTFFYLDADPNKANNLFNSIDSPALLPQFGYDRDTVPSTPIHIEGIINIGVAAISQGGSFDRSARMTRRFFGTFPGSTATAYNGLGNGAIVMCPVAFGASSVMLQALATAFQNPFLPAAGPSSPLLFAQVDHAGNIIGQFTPNTFFTLYPETQQIAVYNTAANGPENPFSLVYDLGL